jgi:DNA topoisomerase-1
VQDAHEAIRVIDPFVTPESLKSVISKDEYALYKLI